MKRREDPSLQQRLQENEQIAAGDDVEPGVGRVLGDVVPGKDNPLPDRFCDPIAVFGLGEEAPEALLREPGGDVRRVHALAGLGNCLLAEVGGKHLDRSFSRLLPQVFEQGEREGIGFYYGRTSGHPHPDGRVPVPALEQGGKDPLLQDLKRLGLAEEAGNVDQDIIIQGSALGGVPLQNLDVVVQGVGPFQKHAPPDPAHDGSVLVIGKVRAGLRSKTGADFTYYKHATIMRRIGRRMFLKRADTLDDYVQVLEGDPAECAALYDDILIHVTGFFREPKAFEVLKKRVLPALLKGRDRDAPIRVWVPGCSTGEEAYSLAISLFEHLGEKAPKTPVQVFATDLSEKAVAQAREGVYPAHIASRLSEERLRRFFTKTEHGYRIAESVRKWIVFSRHDVTKDPPYSRLDIVSCRNLLIFLEPLLQRRVFAALHWALKSDGYLMLGSAETVGELSDYFHVVDSKQKIYSKKSSSVPLQSDFFSRQGLMPEEATPLPRHPMVGVLDVQREADRLVLEEYGPPGIVVDEDMEIVQFRGHAGPYLDPMPGTATLKLLKVARGDLLFHLRGATHKAEKSNAPVRKDAIKVDVEGSTRTINLHVLPVGGRPRGKRHFLVLFEEVPSARPFARKAAEAGPRRERAEVETEKTRRLAEELKAAKSYLRSAVEDQEAFNEELRTGNEEVQ